MANMKQQIKRYKNDNEKRLANNSFKSSLKTAIKAVLTEVEAGNKLDSSVSKGIHHKNYASRQKSRLAKLVNSIEK